MPTWSQLASSFPPLPVCKNKVVLVTNMRKEQLLTHLDKPHQKSVFSCLHDAFTPKNSDWNEKAHSVWNALLEFDKGKAHSSRPNGLLFFSPIKSSGDRYKSMGIGMEISSCEDQLEASIAVH